jgi:chromosome segregation ATPase
MAASTSPAEELTQLKQDLADKQSEVDHLKAQVADLSKTADDIGQKTKAYPQSAADAVNDQVKALTGYVKTEKAMLKAALPQDAVTDVETKKSKALDNLKGLKAKVDQAASDVVKANTAYAAALDKVTASQAAYQAIAGIPAANTDILKDLAALRTAADKLGAANSLARQYFDVLLMEDRLGALNVLSANAYTAKLNDAGSALAAASQDAAKAKDAQATAVQAQQSAQKDLDDARAKWRQETLDSIPATVPTAAPVPPSAGG